MTNNERLTAEDVLLDVRTKNLSGEMEYRFTILESLALIKAYADQQNAELLERVRELEAAQQWQQIETCPWQVGEPYQLACPVKQKDTGKIFWEQHTVWMDEEGSLRCNDYLHEDYFSQWEKDDFTHWMPLPQPPTESVEQERN